jgi:hypothetical protein
MTVVGKQHTRWTAEPYFGAGSTGHWNEESGKTNGSTNNDFSKTKIIWKTWRGGRQRHISQPVQLGIGKLYIPKMIKKWRCFTNKSLENVARWTAEPYFCNRSIGHCKESKFP